MREISKPPPSATRPRLQTEIAYYPLALGSMSQSRNTRPEREKRNGEGHKKGHRAFPTGSGPIVGSTIPLSRRFHAGQQSSRKYAACRGKAGLAVALT